MERNHSLKITNGGHQWGTLKKLQVPQRKKEKKKTDFGTDTTGCQ